MSRHSENLVAGADVPASEGDPRLIWQAGPQGRRVVGTALSCSRPMDEQLANARLWAAAPLLLRELKRLVGRFGFGEAPQDQGDAEAIADALAAIQQAEGTSP